jgi:hypothetical protein
MASSHPHHADAKRSMKDKLNRMIAERGEYPPDRAARIAGDPENRSSRRSQETRPEEEDWTAAPPRQVSNLGRVKGD